MAYNNLYNAYAASGRQMHHTIDVISNCKNLEKNNIIWNNN